MITFPNAKINLGLFVTEKRPDGYHNLETVFYPLPWQDALEAVPAKEFSLTITGKHVKGAAETNLVSKAYQLLLQHFPAAVKPLAFYLHKMLPMGAGLGGGSADGTFALRLINDVCGLQLSDDALEPFAMQLGADCPFFIRNKACFASGRGEQLEMMNLDLSAWSVQVAVPGIHVSTMEAFAGITPRPAGFDLRQLSALPVAAWRAVIRNDFEETVFAAYPDIEKLQQSFYAAGALYAAMSGTGSAVFGIFEKGKKAKFPGLETFYLD